MSAAMETFLWILIAAGLSTFFTWRYHERKPVKVAPAPGPPKPTDDIYQLAGPLIEHFQSTVHPKDVLANPAFLAAADTLANSNKTDDELLQYLLLDAPLVTTLVLEALAQRGGTDLRDRIVLRLNTLTNVWSRYFLLRAIRTMTPAGEPIVGRVVATVDSSWIENYSERMSSQLLKEFAALRIRDGEKPAFDGYLKGRSPEQLENIEKILNLFDDDVAQPLRAELHAWKGSQIDIRWLSSVGKVWTKDQRPDFEPLLLDEFSPSLSKIEGALTGQRRRSVILVGDAGVGKTAMIHLMIDRLLENGWIVFQAGYNDLVAGQTFVGQFEDRLQKLMAQLYGSGKILWYVPDFSPLSSAGRHVHNPTGALDTLLPLIETGKILIISETQPGPFQRMAQDKPRLTTALEILQVNPLSEDLTRRLAEKWSERHTPADAPPLVRKDVFDEAWQLADEHLSFTAAPGNLLELLERARQALESKTKSALPRQLGVDDVVGALSGMSGIPTKILDEREDLDLAALQAMFNQRVLGQAEAVECLVARVALIKAGLTDPSRPLGVFLFAGPTGTGKTEIAKTLTEFLFGSADRMIRLDMSEFKAAESLGRLVGEERSIGGSLVEQVRKRPFSILLLDEFEKAHPNIWDCFLQVFDEGRLTDWQGRPVDFRHCLIIMTSNIGASIQTYGKAGFFSKTGEFLPSNVSAALEREFRKEFLNRIDRIIVFRPLTRETMRGILRKELADAYGRRGLRTRPWAIEWDDSAIEFLLEKGFTVDLGARPLKRAIEQYVLTPLATTIVNRKAPSGDQFLFIRAERDQLVVDFVDPDAPPAAAAAPPVTPTGEITLEGLILDARGKPAELMFLEGEYRKLTNKIQAPEWARSKSVGLSMMSLPEFWNSPERFSILNQVEYRDRVEVAVETAESLFRRARTATREVLVRLAQQLFLIRAAVVALERNEPWEAFVLIEGSMDTRGHDGNEFVMTLRDMYRGWAERRGMRVADLSENPQSGPQLLAFSGFAAYTLLADETGLHVLELPRDSGTNFERVQVRVRVVPQPIEPFQPGMDPRTIAMRLFQSPLANQTVVRRYRELPSPLVRDSVRNWRTGRLDLVLDGNFDLMHCSGGL
jgi:ATP-dependent Clp protease ATP-binding subunit ClpC